MLDFSDFPRCRACPNQGGAHGCAAYGGEGIDPLSAVARCIADRPGDQVAGFPAGAVAYVGTYTTIVTAPALTDLPGPAHLSRARTLRDLLAPYQGKRVRITIEPLPARSR